MLLKSACSAWQGLLLSALHAFSRRLPWLPREPCRQAPVSRSTMDQRLCLGVLHLLGAGALNLSFPNDSVRCLQYCY